MYLGLDFYRVRLKLYHKCHNYDGSWRTDYIDVHETACTFVVCVGFLDIERVVLLMRGKSWRLRPDDVRFANAAARSGETRELSEISQPGLFAYLHQLRILALRSFYYM